MKRIALFLITNLAILFVLSVTLKLLGLDRVLDESGTGLDYSALLASSAVIGFTGALISLALSKWSAKRMTGARSIVEPRTELEQWLVATVRRQAQHAGIGMPEVAVYASPDLNAFATGMNRNKALVAVSTGLLERMPRNEVEAVLAHEVSHVANGDMVTLTLIQGVVNTFVVFLSRVIGHAVDRIVFKTEREHGPAFYVVSLVAQLVLGVLASAIVMWFSRQREFRADAGGAQLAGRANMIAALQRLGGGVAGELPEKMAAFGISGARGGALARLFSTHPSIDDRVAALRAGVATAGH